MLERVKRLGKDPFSLFIKSQKGREVKFPKEIQQMAIQRFGKKYPTFLKTLNNDLRDINIGAISFIGRKKEQTSWFTPAREQKPAKVVINVAEFPFPNTPEFLEEIKKLKQKTESKTTLTIEEPEAIQKIPEKVYPPLVETSPPEKSQEEIPSQPLLLELSKGLKIFIPDVQKLGIEAEPFQDRSSIGIELKRRNGKTLVIWQFKRWPSEINIGERDYKLERDHLNLIDEKTRTEYPLKKGEQGEIILDLSKIINFLKV